MKKRDESTPVDIRSHIGANGLPRVSDARRAGIPKWVIAKTIASTLQKTVVHHGAVNAVDDFVRGGGIASREFDPYEMAWVNASIPRPNDPWGVFEPAKLEQIMLNICAVKVPHVTIAAYEKLCHWLGSEPAGEIVNKAAAKLTSLNVLGFGTLSAFHLDCLSKEVAVRLAKRLQVKFHGHEETAEFIFGLLEKYKDLQPEAFEEALGRTGAIACACAAHKRWKGDPPRWAKDVYKRLAVKDKVVIAQCVMQRRRRKEQYVVRTKKMTYLHDYRDRDFFPRGGDVVVVRKKMAQPISPAVKIVAFSLIYRSRTTS